MRSFYNFAVFTVVWAISALSYSFAQQPDSNVLGFRVFLNQVLDNHPVVKQAILINEAAAREVLAARGAFDPVLSAGFREKFFNKKEYYSYFNPTVKIPTWFGMELKGGYEQTDGLFLNPEGTLPANGQIFAGISLPLLRGLVIDQRRASLRQAKLLTEMAGADQLKLVNKIIFEAAKDYWTWSEMFQKLELMNTGYRFSIERLDFIKKTVMIGEMPGIDTVEAIMELNRREILLNDAKNDFRNSELYLSNYLWDENGNPMELRPGLIPQEPEAQPLVISQDSLERLIVFAGKNHPDIQKLDIKLRQLEIERKLRAEMLKPALNIDYNPLLTAPFNSSELSFNHFSNNYKLGASFYMPVFLRKERGGLQKAKISISRTELELANNKRILLNNIRAAYNELLNLGMQLNLQNQLVNNSVIMRNGEETRFENGESSQFLINMRERFLIDAQLKLVEMRAKQEKTRAAIQWAAGMQVK